MHICKFSCNKFRKKDKFLVFLWKMSESSHFIREKERPLSETAQYLYGFCLLLHLWQDMLQLLLHRGGNQVVTLL